MSNKAVIDELEIIIEAEDKGAANTLDKLIEDLEKLNNAGNNTSGSKSAEGLANAADKATKETEALYRTLTKTYNSVSQTYGAVGRTYNSIAQSFRATQNLDRGNIGENLARRFGQIATAAERASSQASGMRNLSSAVNQVGAGAERSNIALRGIAQTLLSVSRNALSFATFPFARIGSSLSNIHSKILSIGSGLMRIAKFRIYRTIIKLITSGFKEGIDNAYKWSQALGGQFAASMDSLATSALYLKNSLGAMAMPLINAVAPAFDFIIDKIVTFLNLVNQLIARLTGASTWTRAVKNTASYGGALDSAAGSAEKLEEALITILGIDEINPMEGANDSASPSGGSGGASGGGVGDMFVTEPLDKFSGKLEELFDPFKKAWEKKGEGLIKSINNALTNTKKLAVSVGRSFWEVWTNGTGQESIEHILGIFTGIFNVIGNIAGQLDKGWNTNNLGTRIIQHIWDMLNDILGMWDNIANNTANWAAALDFVPIFSAIEKALAALEPVVKTVTDVIDWAWKEIVLPIGKWLIESALPVVIETIAEAIKLVGNIIETAKPHLQYFWDKWLKPLGEFSGKAIIQVLTDLKDSIADINAVFDGSKAWSDALNDIMDRITKYVPILATFVKAINQVAHGDFAGAYKTISTMNGVFDGLLDQLMGIEEKVTEVLDPFSTTGIKEIQFTAAVTDIEDKIPAARKVLTNFVASIAEWVKENTFIGKILGFQAGLAEWIIEKTFLGKILGFIAGLAGWEKEDSFVSKILGFQAGLAEWALENTFAGKIAKFIAGLLGWDTEKGFNFSISGFAASLFKWDTDKAFSFTIPGFIASLVDKTKGSGFSSTITDMIAQFAKSGTSNGFSKTIEGLSASFSSSTLGSKFTKAIDMVSNFTGKTIDKEKFGKQSMNMIANFTGKTLDKDKFGKQVLNMVSNFTGKTIDKGKFGNQVLNMISNFTGKKKDSGFNSDLNMVANLTKTTGYSISGEYKVTSVVNSGKGLYAAEGGSLYGNRWHAIPQYAAGGEVNHGSMFIAGESGAELVGHIGGRTEVLNQSQMAAALAAGMEPQSQLLRQLVTIGQQMLENQNGSGGYTSPRDMVDGFRRLNRRDGKTVVPMGV